MADEEEKYGITGALTFKESPAEAVQLSKDLAKYLEESNFFESEQSGQTRERVLGRLDFLLKQFVDSIAPAQDKRRTGGKIFTFGSYRLGVHDRGADIDALCVVPRHVHRSDFFTIFYDKLRLDPDVSELSKVEDAYVPLIKMKFCDIPIDLTFARLNLTAVHENLTLLNDSLLRSMNEKCIVSLNGSRVTDAMLNLIPSTDVFHAALRAIKFWAKRRFVYGASYGYFGGVAFSICVARICQMYPSYCAYDIVCKFFETYSTWKWPTPVILRPVIDLNYHLKVWDPKIYPADKYNKMPVITPAYPSMCSTSNVTQSTSAVITAEFTRGYEILKSSNDFTQIFNFSDFFKKYKLFVEISIKSTNADDYLVWNGYVESKVRFLANKLENVENVVGAIPFPKGFKSGNAKPVIRKVDEDDLVNDTNFTDDFKRIKVAESGKSTAGSDTSSNAIKEEDKVDSAKSVVKEVFESSPVEMLSKSELAKNNSRMKNVEECKSIKTSELSKKKEDTPLTTSFFIAIDVTVNKTTGKKFYVDGPIKEFLEFMNGWEKKTENMFVDVKAMKRKDVQNFVKRFYDDE